MIEWQGLAVGLALLLLGFVFGWLRVLSAKLDDHAKSEEQARGMLKQLFHWHAPDSGGRQTWKNDMHEVIEKLEELIDLIRSQQKER
tara:strand:+ start:272 stop:532 length:261 start_codon:yes stop_codon:yes gene_type:complete